MLGYACRRSSGLPQDCRQPRPCPSATGRAHNPIPAVRPYAFVRRMTTVAMLGAAQALEHLRRPAETGQRSAPDVTDVTVVTEHLGDSNRQILRTTPPPQHSAEDATPKILQVGGGGRLVLLLLELPRLTIARIAIEVVVAVALVVVGVDAAAVWQACEVRRVG